MLPFYNFSENERFHSANLSISDLKFCVSFMPRWHGVVIVSLLFKPETPGWVKLSSLSATFRAWNRKTYYRNCFIMMALEAIVFIRFYKL